MAETQNGVRVKLMGLRLFRVLSFNCVPQAEVEMKRLHAKSSFVMRIARQLPRREGM
jgi:hypothetical protein